MRPDQTKFSVAMLGNGKKKALIVESDTFDEVAVTAISQTEIKEKLDFAVKNVSTDRAVQLGDHERDGVVISQVVQTSRVRSESLRPGMVILEVNGQGIRNTREFVEALEELEESKGTLLLVRDGLYSKYINLHVI
jgi:S1-C subfamily serine protease